MRHVIADLRYGIDEDNGLAGGEEAVDCDVELALPKSGAGLFIQFLTIWAKHDRAFSPFAVLDVKRKTRD